MATSVSITAEPIDERRRNFILDRAVHTNGVRKYSSAEEAGDAPLAQAVLGVPDVCEVVLSGNVLTVVQNGNQSWGALEPQIRYAIEAATHAENDVGFSGRVEADDEEAMYQYISDVFDEQINPAVAQHGGKVELIDVQEGVVVLRMLGGCQGCGMANVTLRQGIEAALKRMIPGFQGLKDITDHSAGTNPYFQAGSK